MKKSKKLRYFFGLFRLSKVVRHKLLILGVKHNICIFLCNTKVKTLIKSFCINFVFQTWQLAYCIFNVAEDCELTSTQSHTTQIKKKKNKEFNKVRLSLILGRSRDSFSLRMRRKTLYKKFPPAIPIHRSQVIPNL